MAVDIVVPPLGESVVEATVLNWLKKEGDTVAEGDPVVELETDKVNMEVYAPRAGVLGSIGKPAGATVAIGESLGTVNENGTGQHLPQPPPSQGGGPVVPVTSTAAAGNGEAAPPATPVAQKMAEAQSIDLSKVKGTGPGGKVTKDDVTNFTSAPKPTPPQAAPAPTKSPLFRKEGVGGGAPAHDSGHVTLTLSEQRREERVPITRLRETIMRRLKEAQNSAAMLTTFNEVDMSAVMEVRKRRKDSFKEKHGVNLGFMSFFTKAVVGALKAFPYVNAEILEEEKTILVKRYYDIGVAVSTERGLVVPVLRDADAKGFADIEKGIVDLAARARENKLTLPELAGGTFTITNGGVFGSLMSTPILNAPQVGILGMHKIQERPVVVNGEIVIRPMMYLALSYDHRIVDGSEAVRFLVRVKELIEDPESLLLEG
jgi:2-oxoglutarate dehydrogenase E2 component (dihydrolipoamide succinyltransferase)